MLKGGLRRNTITTK